MAHCLECISDWTPVFLPLIAFFALITAKVAKQPAILNWAQAAFFGGLLLVAGMTLRTVVANDPCWLFHTSSLGMLIVGALVQRSSESYDSAPHSADAYL